MLTYTFNILFFNLLAVYIGFTRFTQTTTPLKFPERSACTGLHEVGDDVNPIPLSTETLSREIYTVNRDYTTNYCMASFKKTIVLITQGFRTNIQSSIPEPGLYSSKPQCKQADRTTLKTC